MAKLKITGDLFLGKQELNHMVRSLDNKGYKEFIKHMIKSYGVARTFDDAAFDSFRVIAGSSGGNLSLKSGYAFDNSLNIIHNNETATDILTSASDSTTRYVILTNQVSVIEEGTLDVSISGSLTGTGTLFSEVLRGGNDFPSKISFPDSSVNTGEYNISTVTSDTVAQLNVAASSMTAESGIKYRVVGTFTPGINPTTSAKYPLEKNGYSVSLENSNTANGLTTFVLASVIYDGTTLTIADLRTTNQFSSGGESLSSLITTNPLAGVEQVTYGTVKSSKESNLITVGWGFSSDSSSWSFNASTSQVTITAGSGGAWNSKSSFTNGDFNGWILYVKEDGQTLDISNSQTSGGNIVLDVEFTSSIPSSSEIIVVPNAEHIEFSFENAGILNAVKTESFPIHEGHAQLPIAAGVQFTVKWRHISGTQSTGFELINDGDYYKEDQFNIVGGLNGGATQTAYTSGIITTTLNPDNHQDDKASINSNNTFVASNTFADEAKFQGPRAIPAQISTLNGVQNDSTLFSTRNHNRFFVETSPLTFTGVLSVTNEEIITISNRETSTQDIVISHDSGLSASSNRFRCPLNRELRIEPGHNASFISDGTDGGWVFYGASFTPHSKEWTTVNIASSEVVVTGTQSGYESSMYKYRIIEGICHIQIQISYETDPGAVSKIVWTIPNSAEVIPSSTKNLQTVPGAAHINNTTDDAQVFVNTLTNKVTFDAIDGSSGGASNSATFRGSFTWAID